jgi:hypothetical protein
MIYSLVQKSYDYFYLDEGIVLLPESHGAPGFSAVRMDRPEIKNIYN